MTDQAYEMTISRYFDAPPALVYQAFVDPAQMAQWFGPLTFHVPLDSIEVDARTGGHWKLTMVNNDHPEMASPVNSTLTEVIENELIVGVEIAKDFPGMADGTEITLRLAFTPEGDGTRLELRQGPFPEMMREMSETGWNQSLYKLDALLATPAKFRSAPVEA